MKMKKVLCAVTALLITLLPLTVAYSAPDGDIEALRGSTL
jgi:hypothetical protein